MEFSIPDGISNTDVICAYPMSGGQYTGDVIYNPNYRGG